MRPGMACVRFARGFGNRIHQADHCAECTADASVFSFGEPLSPVNYWRQKGGKELHAKFPQLEQCTEVLAPRILGGRKEADRLIDSLFERYAAEWLRFSAQRPVFEPETILAL